MGKVVGALLVVVVVVVGMGVVEGFDEVGVVFNQCNTGKFVNGSAASQDLEVVMEAVGDLAASTTFSTARYNSFYAIFQCRGDVQVSNSHCADCVAQAKRQALAKCPNAIGQKIQLQGCYLRYEEYNFLKLDTSVVVTFCNVNKNKDIVFQQSVGSILTSVITSASNNQENYYASANVQGIYAVAQCLGYLSPSECSSCLAKNSNGWQVCNNAVGAQVHSVSCFYRYETYAFFNA